MDLEANFQVIEKQTKENFDNGKEYVGLTETPYQNLICLDRRVMIIEERFAGHKSFLSQKVVWHEVWTRGLWRRHSYRQ